MMVSVAFEVNFRVKAKTRTGEVLCLVGGSSELGDWNVQKAIRMQRETKRKQDDEASSSFEECPEDGDIWSKKLRFEGFDDRYYRYVICRLFASDTEEGETGVLVKWWEGHISPRRFSPQEAMNTLELGHTPDPDVFGEHDGIRLINWGWLTGQSEIQIRFHSNPIKMWKPRYREQTYSIKCTPIDHRYRDQMDDTHEEELLGDGLPQCARTNLLVSVLEKGRSKPRPQGDFGAVYQPNNYMTFHAKTFDPESLGFQLDFYVVNEGSEPKPVGFCFILPLDLEHTKGARTVPITGYKHKPIGQLRMNYFIVKTLMGASFSMKKTYQRYWKSTRRAVDVGHRGMGTSYKCKKLANVTENTIRSLQSAANHGADFVEFDVHLTKDRIPVIYHDFKVCMTYRKKKRDDLELFELPVKDAKLSELQSMKLAHPACQPEHLYDGIGEDDLDPDDLQPFPTLKQVFQSVDKDTGFNIEVKYPMLKIDGTNQMPNYFDLNKFVDTILKVVFENHAGRRIIFSSFDPDCCTALRLKQNRYPVLFLTQADTKQYMAYDDPRALTVEMATEFALSAGLLGVDVVSDVLLDNMSLISYVKDAGLVLFVWGEKCNDKNTISKLRENQVDGIIYDRIDHFKTSGKESIFKLEYQQKKELLQRLGSIVSDDSIDSHDSGSDHNDW